MAEHLDKGTFGEQGAGFFFGSQGYFLVDGPSGTQGHAANAPGFDGVAYNAKIDDLIIYDNKTFKSSSNVSQGTAIDPAKNLPKNLDNLISRVQNINGLPSQARILNLLRQTRSSLTTTGVKPPSNVRIAISNYGGNSQGITKSFAERGIRFIDMNSAPTPPARPSRLYFNLQTIKSMSSPAMTGAQAYNARRATVNAAAASTRFIAQEINDFSLRVAIDREMEKLKPSIGEALVRGRGVLVVIRIDEVSPPGIVGGVVTRSVSSAFIFTHPNNNREEAIQAWERQPKIEAFRPPHVKLRISLTWIPAPTIH